MRKGKLHLRYSSTQVLEHLPSTHKVLSSNPSTARKKETKKERKKLRKS
jgi:hypothetical protein